ncbi:CD109 antigen like protein [Argiope bruennichi]|uniref:CD109 antigen like protein n=1 Tax=Argiope bruennichi TaxID=94029 RepID=A0A8T0EBJ0_ARGBR|nr:CD109 antigen like protein [Argiope bruennichi]
MILRLLLLWCLRTVSAQEYPSDRSQRIKHEPTYFIAASQGGVELAAAWHDCKPNAPETLLIKVPPTILPGTYHLRVEGGVQGVLGGTAFHNETELQYSRRSLTIFIETDQPIYRQGQTIRFRAIPVTTDLRAFPEAVDVFILDPMGIVVQKWLSRQTNLGAVSLEYHLSQQPRYGNWTIRVVAQGQVEEKMIYIEEYYQTAFEVNVTLPAFILESERHIQCSVTAKWNECPTKNYTDIFFSTTGVRLLPDGSPLPSWRLNDQKLELRTKVRLSGGREQELETRFEQMSPVQFGIWEISVDLLSEFGTLSALNDVQSLLLEARYADESGERARTSLLVYASYTPTHRHLQVTTSTRDAKVGEYIIFHVRADYYVQQFYYMVVSKSSILLSGAEEMPSSLKTFAVPCSSEMAPTASLVVWDMAREGEVVADALTFPVDGLSRNNFSVILDEERTRLDRRSKWS